MQKRRIVAALLSAAMMLTAAPFTAFAANADSASNGGVAVNKTASALQSRESTVTLTVGAPDGSSTVVANDPIAIEFVVDATDSLFYVDENNDTLIDAMADALTQLADKNVYVGLTVFTSTAMQIQVPKLLTSVNRADMKKTIETIANYKGVLSSPAGTNIEAGLKTAADALSDFKCDKYVVLVTDGGAYWWNKSDTDSTPVSQTFGSGTPTGNTDVVETTRTLASDYQTEIAKYRSIDRSAASHATSEWTGSLYVPNIVKGTYFAKQAADAVNANLITVGLPYEYGKLKDYAASFIENLPGAKINGDGMEYDEMFSAILSEVCVIPSGTITDVIGKGTDNKYQQYNFDIQSGSKVTLTIGGKSETKAFANSISFFDGKYVFTYHSGSDEYFTLAINEPILPSAPLKLSYTVYLADRGSKDGTHSELYTNVEATLDTPVGEYTFPRPEVSYRIDGGSSSGGKIDIEEPEVPQGLNGDDHFQYVMGYTDGTVRPLAKITRAEVAAIFYRLLDDETRERYFTTENDFPDMKDTMWYNKAVSTLSNAGIITGCSDGLFHGSRNITRAELATIIAKFDDHVYEGRDYFNDISTHWARAFINSSADNGWIVGDGSGKFRPYDDITRAEVMTMINAVLNRAVDEDGLCDGYKKWPDNPKTAWYYYQVIEATNYHDYEREADMTEDWIEILPDKVWNEAGVD